MPKDPNELGALWVKSSSKGDYMTGTINGVAVVCFRNKSDNAKAPQWRVLKSTGRGSEKATPDVQNISDADIAF